MYKTQAMQNKVQFHHQSNAGRDPRVVDQKYSTPTLGSRFSACYSDGAGISEISRAY